MEKFHIVQSILLLQLLNKDFYGHVLNSAGWLWIEGNWMPGVITSCSKYIGYIVQPPLRPSLRKLDDNFGKFRAP